MAFVLLHFILHDACIVAPLKANLNQGIIIKLYFFILFFILPPLRTRKYISCALKKINYRSPAIILFFSFLISPVKNKVELTVYALKK